MILQSLVGYYQREAKDPESGIAPFGLEKKEIKFVIEIDENGKFINFKDTRGGGKTGQIFLLPKMVSRQSNVVANLLWDNASYLLGYSKKMSDKDALHLAAFIEKIRALPEEIKNDRGVSAVLKFYDNGEMKKVFEHPNWQECQKIASCNISFQLKGDSCLVPERETTRAWIETHADSSGAEGEVQGRCLVTGDFGPIARTHSKFSVGGQQAALVSFQVNSGYDSYGKEQGYNAPVTEKAEFEYATALKTLLGSEHNRTYLADMTLVFWAQPKEISAEDARKIEDAFSFFVSTPYDESKRSDANVGTEAVKNLFESIYTGKIPVDAGDRFFILGVTPNKARLAVKLWQTGTISEFSKRIVDHFNDFDIVRSPRDKPYPTLREILTSTALLYKMDNVPPNLPEAVLMSILNGTPYPVTLFQQDIRRIRAERNITRDRAAIIKAYLNRLARAGRRDIKEVAMSLDKANKDVAYRLGRLFAVLEKVQEEANPGLNATIRDRYYGAISSSPATVFPLLMKLKNHHLAKLDSIGRKTYFEKEIGEIISEITPETMPKHLSLEKQGYFSIGYYHERQSFFIKQDKTAD
jgi:CRISPR-associated protein Csd1